jgi:integrase
LLDGLVLHLETKGAKAIDSLKSHLKPVREFFNLRRAVEVSTTMVERYQHDRLKADKKRATVNRELEPLKQAFNLARKQGRLTRIPYIPKLTEDNARQGFFEKGQFLALCEKLPEHLADVARFAYLSGWRRGEILPLTWDAVDRQGLEVRLRTSKSGAPRTLPLEGDLWDLMERRWKAREFEVKKGVTTLSEFVFHAGDGRSVVDFKRSWATACEKAGCPGKLFHDLRRTAVRDMIRAGVPQSVAMRVSGHKTTAIFLRYDITSESDKQDALRKVQAHREAQPTAKPNVAQGNFGEKTEAR